MAAFIWWSGASSALAFSLSTEIESACFYSWNWRTFCPCWNMLGLVTTCAVGVYFLMPYGLILVRLLRSLSLPWALVRVPASRIVIFLSLQVLIVWGPKFGSCWSLSAALRSWYFGDKSTVSLFSIFGSSVVLDLQTWTQYKQIHCVPHVKRRDLSI